MRLDYIRPFTDASNEILQNYIKDGIKIGDITLKGDFVNASGIIAIVALSNDIVGHFIIDMKLETAKKIVSIMNDREIKDIDKLSLSTLQELVNLIAGLALTKLETDGYDVDISPPVIMKSKNLEVSISDSEFLHIKLDTSIGDFNILVAVESEKE
ncbi:chemotaxis protein CheX [Brachyspira hyodysenteriae]|nr:chemotaxis protein CheX [Brachyspira hyodysenteriae]MDA0062706.1 chemotaxis protein CheX [Brachyspira hyodysenteriae]MDA0095684.1 chemotaxis protein CheX [Brachyspira hyodysenteriae]